MQQAFAILETGVTATVGKSMEKRGQIPSAKPNAAPRAEIDRVKTRIEKLGLDWHAATKQAGLAYATSYRLLKGEASVGSLRTLEEWVVKEEARQKKPPMPTAAEQDARLAEWLAIGAELAQVDVQRFVAVLDGLRDVLTASKLEQNAFRKILRATPDHDR